ncbi:ElyC/SanA/YdcF family protein [Paludicola sp. MB14-C6]|uniref:SanA/YdcF family protein n=1 Tax=Paludihabitans sp. MB14-C6 TaxID=3070656 RepID=UPI0027DB5D27|nr:ElyC/SanA/YdcF family protein [Paludicola sp. MB14-C6]WMJ22465.1 ElyC/SanA/YdcF family protein [Paludicola sp. MB14-C6]
MKKSTTPLKHKKLKIIFLIVIILIVLCTIAAFCINGYVISSTKGRILTIDQTADIKADCIIVLGAGLKPDGTPNHMLEDRVLTGIEVYQESPTKRLLMSGDHGRKNYDEVNAMKAYAKEKGISSETIFMDHAGFSTYETMYRARDIFQAKKVIIVTQKYHLYRSLYIAKTLGLDAYGVASNPRTYQGQAYRDFREVLARNKDFFKVIFKPNPTYLGEAIPINGNGNLTNDK